jgi:hypothetical protein
VVSFGARIDKKNIGDSAGLHALHENWSDRLLHLLLLLLFLLLLLLFLELLLMLRITAPLLLLGSNLRRDLRRNAGP